MSLHWTAGILRKAWHVRFLTAALVVAAALNFQNSWSLAAQDPFQPNIATILADPNKYLTPQRISPSAYRALMFSLEGTVQEPKLRDDLSGTGKKTCTQTFNLTDNTGSIAAFFVLACDVVKQNGLILSHGDRIVVDSELGSSGIDGKGNPLGLYLIIKKLSR